MFRGIIFGIIIISILASVAPIIFPGDPTIVYIVAGFILVIGGIIYLAFVYEKKRTEFLKKKARMIGFNFKDKPTYVDVGKIAGLPLFNKGHSRKYKNLMSGRKGGMDWKIFDYSYSVGHGKSQQHHSMTVFASTMGSLQFPNFILSPEYFIHRIGKVFGLKDINFEHDKTFSDKYLLQGKDEVKIRELFSRQLLRQLGEGKEKLNIFGSDDMLIFTRRKRISIKEGMFNKRFEKISKLASVFKDSAESV